MNDLLASTIVQLLLFTFLPFIWWLITARKKQNFFNWIGFKKPIFTISKTKIFLAAVLISMIFAFIMTLVMANFLSNVNTATIQFYNEGWGAFPKILVFAIIQTGLSETILFRGFIGKRAINKFGFVIGNSIQALIFGLAHGLPFGFVTRNVLVIILLTILPGTIGWLEGLLIEKYSSGSIIPAWIIHSVMNIISGLSAAL
jgi:membrane protease YdiL (CAAX protease family)